MAFIRFIIIITASALLDASLAVRHRVGVANTEIQPRGIPLIGTWVNGLDNSSRSPESPEGYKFHSVPKEEVLSTPHEPLRNNFMGEFNIDQVPSSPLEGHDSVTSIQPFMDGQHKPHSVPKVEVSLTSPERLLNNYMGEFNIDQVPSSPLEGHDSVTSIQPFMVGQHKPHSVPKVEVSSTSPERLLNNFMGEFNIDQVPSSPLEGHDSVTSIQPFMDGQHKPHSVPKVEVSSTSPERLLNNFMGDSSSIKRIDSGMPQVSSGAHHMNTSSEVQAFRDVPDKMFNNFFRVMHNRLARKSGGSITMEQFREYCARENGPAVAWLEANGLDGIASPHHLLWLIDRFDGPTEAYTSKAWVETMMRLVHQAQDDIKHMPTLPIEDVTDLSGASATSLRAVSIVLETPVFSDIWPVRCDGQSANGIAISGLDTSGFACDPTGFFVGSPPILKPTTWAKRDFGRGNGLHGDEYVCYLSNCLKLKPELHHVYLPFSKAAQRVFSQSQALSTVIPSSQRPTVKTAVTTDAGAKVPVVIRAMNSRGVVALVSMRMLDTDLEFEPTESRLTPSGLQFLKDLVNPMGALVLRQIAAYKIEAKRSVKVLFCAHGSTTATAENIDPALKGLPLDRARTVVDHLQLAKPEGEAVHVDDEGIGHYDEEVKDFHGGRYGYIIYKVFDASLKSAPKCQREDLYCFLPELRKTVGCT